MKDLKLFSDVADKDIMTDLENHELMLSYIELHERISAIKDKLTKDEKRLIWQRKLSEGEKATLYANLDMYCIAQNVVIQELQTHFPNATDHIQPTALRLGFDRA